MQCRERVVRPDDLCGTERDFPGGGERRAVEGAETEGGGCGDAKGKSDAAVRRMPAGDLRILRGNRRRHLHLWRTGREFIQVINAAARRIWPEGRTRPITR